MRTGTDQPDETIAIASPRFIFRARTLTGPDGDGQEAGDEDPLSGSRSR